MSIAAQSMKNRIKHTIKTGAFLCGVAFVWAGTAADAANAPKMPSRDSHDSAIELPGISDAFQLPYTSSRLDAALDFIRDTGIAKNLSLLLLHDVKDEAPVQAAIRRYGMDRVQTTVVQVIRSAQVEYGADWNRMLAEIYTAHFDVAALKSLTAQKDASPHFIRLIELQDDIAAAMKARGQGILSKARSDVMRQIRASLPV